MSALATPQLEALRALIRQADLRVRPYIRETPLRRGRSFESKAGSSVWLKCENLQDTGSFKLRGATNKLLSLTPEQKERGIATASSGNHGLAVAHAGRRLGIAGTVFLPENVPPNKARAIEASGIRIKYFGEDCAVTEAHAREYSEAHGLTYISPYNDLEVIAGQGTLAGELSRQVPPLGQLYVSVGGGGLISGLGAAIKQHWPEVELVACSPRASAVMIESLQAGRVLDLPSLPTLSDGTAGGLEQGTVTFPLCQALVDRCVQVEEEAIVDAVRRLHADQNFLVEGAAGVALAAALQEAGQRSRLGVGVLLCGGNVSEELSSAIGLPAPGALSSPGDH